MKKVNLRAKVLISLASVALVGALAFTGCAQMGVAADEASEAADEAAIETVADEAADEAVEAEIETPDEEAPEAEAAEPAAVVDGMDPTAPYTSDEACLACHGGSYEANAANTADFGIWNPHDSIHGGYNSCDNCHEKGQEVTRNWCGNCHTYSAEGSDYYEAPLFL